MVKRSMQRMLCCLWPGVSYISWSISYSPFTVFCSKECCHVLKKEINLSHLVDATRACTSDVTIRVKQVLTVVVRKTPDGGWSMTCAPGCFTSCNSMNLQEV